jgi:hypothetical protein
MVAFFVPCHTMALREYIYMLMFPAIRIDMIFGLNPHVSRSDQVILVPSPTKDEAVKSPYRHALRAVKVVGCNRGVLVYFIKCRKAANEVLVRRVLPVRLNSCSVAQKVRRWLS